LSDCNSHLGTFHINTVPQTGNYYLTVITVMLLTARPTVTKAVTEAAVARTPAAAVTGGLLAAVISIVIVVGVVYLVLRLCLRSLRNRYVPTQPLSLHDHDEYRPVH